MHEPASRILSLLIHRKDLTRQRTDRNVGRMEMIVIDSTEDDQYIGIEIIAITMVHQLLGIDFQITFCSDYVADQELSLDSNRQ